MSTILKIEDFLAWQKARELNLLIHQTVDLKPYNQLLDLRNQMRKSSRSVMANLAEGFARNGNKEFLNFISIARGSLIELKSDVYFSLDMVLVPKETFDAIMTLIEEVDKLCNGMTRHLKSSTLKGAKFNHK